MAAAVDGGSEHRESRLVPHHPLLVLGGGVSVHVTRMVFGTAWLPPLAPELAFLVLAVLVLLVVAGLWTFRAHGRLKGSRASRLSCSASACPSTSARI